MRKTHALGIAVVLICLFFLVGLFMPSWWCHHYREQSREDACANNLKQLGLALNQYRQDFDERYPWRTGAANPDEAWLDLGMVFPNYNSSFRSFRCPGGEDRPFEPVCALGPKKDHPLEPFYCASSAEVISYAYCFNAGDPGQPVPWTSNARATIRLLADKKAATRVGSRGNPVKMANHTDKGRNVLYNDGHVKWKPGPGALDPDEDRAAIGDPSATDYTAWWSDPPYYDE